MTVHKLPAIAKRDNEANEQLISVLGKLLDEATSGQLRGFVYCCEFSDGAWRSGSGGLIKTVETVGMMEIAKYQVLKG